MPDFEFRDLAAQPTLVIRAERVPVTQIPVVLAEVLPATWQFLQERGISEAGPPFVRYSNMSEGAFDLEGGFPVSTPVEGEGRVTAAELPAGSVATGWHIGPYDRIGETFDALVKWGAEQGKQPAGDPWEVYWSDPAETSPDELRTQVFCPVA